MVERDERKQKRPLQKAAFIYLKKLISSVLRIFRFASPSECVQQKR